MTPLLEVTEGTRRPLEVLEERGGAGGYADADGNADAAEARNGRLRGAL